MCDTTDNRLIAAHLAAALISKYDQMSAEKARRYRSRWMEVRQPLSV
jgi:hypothetical protein